MTKLNCDSNLLTIPTRETQSPGTSKQHAAFEDCWGNCSSAVSSLKQCHLNTQGGDAQVGDGHWQHCAVEPEAQCRERGELLGQHQFSSCLQT